MLSKAIFGAALLAIGAIPASVSALAQSPREAEIVGLHQLCDHGDRRACVRFGMLIGENRERHAEWRRQHPDWWWWER
jgi:hypothetical protein